MSFVPSRVLLVLVAVLCPLLSNAEDKPDPGSQRVGSHFRTLQGAAQAGIDPISTPTSGPSEMRVLSVGEENEESDAILRYVLIALGAAGVGLVGVMLVRKKS